MLIFFKKISARKKLETIMPHLKLVKERLRSSQISNDAVFEIVNFFDYVSKLQDKNIVQMALEAYQETDETKVIDILTNLQKCIDASGRNAHGLNRTLKHQDVTLDDVYISDPRSQVICPVRFWVKNASEDEYQLIQSKAKDFMEPKIAYMIHLISELESVIQ